MFMDVPTNTDNLIFEGYTVTDEEIIIYFDYDDDILDAEVIG